MPTTVPDGAQTLTHLYHKITTDKVYHDSMSQGHHQLYQSHVLNKQNKCGQEAACHACCYGRGSANSTKETLFSSTIKVLLMLVNHVEISDSTAQPN